MRILYVATVGATMGFFPNIFKTLVMQGHDIELACSSSWDYNDVIASFGFKRYDIPFSRSPVSTNNISAYKQLKKVIRQNEYDVIHCHTPIAAIITRLVCCRLRKRGLKVIYTAHGFHFYKGAPLLSWLLYYPLEWLCAHWTDTLITINKEDFTFAQKHMHAKRVKYLPGVGIDLSRFSTVSVDRLEKRRGLNLSDNDIMVLSVGELNENKNHELFIRAIVGKEHIKYYIAGEGIFHDRLNHLINELGIVDHVTLLGFRTDVTELLHAADIFVMPSYREGLSASLMEAMASGLPCIVSRIRGNTDLIDEHGGSTFDPHSVQDVRKALDDVVFGDFDSLGKYNQEKIRGFSSEIVCNKMMEYYRETQESK